MDIPLFVFIAALLSVGLLVINNKPGLGPQKPDPDQIIARLKEGNARFAHGRAVHPHTDRARLTQAGQEDQADHALATVVGCSDSRVPVERIFDVGVMDLFVVRIAGNTIRGDAVGSIEYGLAHVGTPVLVVLGHTQCGAVTAATDQFQGSGPELGSNIQALIEPIIPAVERAIETHPEAHGRAVVPWAIRENIRQGMENLLIASRTVRELVKTGRIRIAGAVYRVDDGLVEWLPDSTATEILARVGA